MRLKSHELNTSSQNDFGFIKMAILNGKTVKCYCVTLNHHVDDGIKSEPHNTLFSYFVGKSERERERKIVFPFQRISELCANDYRCLKLALLIPGMSYIHTNCTVNCIFIGCCISSEKKIKCWKWIHMSDFLWIKFPAT